MYAVLQYNDTGLETTETLPLLVARLLHARRHGRSLLSPRRPCHTAALTCRYTRWCRRSPWQCPVQNRWRCRLPRFSKIRETNGARVSSLFEVIFRLRGPGMKREAQQPSTAGLQRGPLWSVAQKVPATVSGVSTGSEDVWRLPQVSQHVFRAPVRRLQARLWWHLLSPGCPSSLIIESYSILE